MRFFTTVAALMAVAQAAPGFTPVSRTPNTRVGFTMAKPGSVHDMKITKENTLNGTRTGPAKTVSKTQIKTIHADATTATLPLSFVNNLGSDLNAYLSGLDSNGHVAFLGADGSLIYPSSGGSATPVPITQNIAIPVGNAATFNINALSSARIYFAAGTLTFAVVSTGSGDGLVQPSESNLQDPSAGTNWGYVEFTLNTDNSIFANISYVNFVGIILGMALQVNGGDTQESYGLQSHAVASICSDLNDQTKSDGRPWASMCIAGPNGGPLRALAPVDYTAIDPNGFKDYYDDYASQVWSTYSSKPLNINTQTGAGTIACQVSGDTLTCPGDNRGYAKPTADDIWGCNSNTFAKQSGDNDIHLAVIPRLCAAFERTTLLLDGGDTQPSLSSASYYTQNPTNHYSRIVHKYEVNGKGYAFSYDDVNPDGNENASGVVSSGSPKELTIYIGGAPSS